MTTVGKVKRSLFNTLLGSRGGVKSELDQSKMTKRVFAGLLDMLNLNTINRNLYITPEMKGIINSLYADGHLSPADKNSIVALCKHINDECVWYAFVSWLLAQGIKSCTPLDNPLLNSMRTGGVAILENWVTHPDVCHQAFINACYSHSVSKLEPKPLYTNLVHHIMDQIMAQFSQNFQKAGPIDIDTKLFVQNNIYSDEPRSDSAATIYETESEDGTAVWSDTESEPDRDQLGVDDDSGDEFAQAELEGAESEQVGAEPEPPSHIEAESVPGGVDQDGAESVPEVMELESPPQVEVVQVEGGAGTQTRVGVESAQVEVEQEPPSHVWAESTHVGTEPESPVLDEPDTDSIGDLEVDKLFLDLDPLRSDESSEVIYKTMSPSISTILDGRFFGVAAKA